jgi:hypothetical protein
MNASAGKADNPISIKDRTIKKTNWIKRRNKWINWKTNINIKSRRTKIDGTIKFNKS